MGRKKPENTRQTGTPWRKRWKKPENLNRWQNILVMYARRRLTCKNEWVSIHKRGSEGIPLTENPVKNRHADYRGVAVR